MLARVAMTGKGVPVRPRARPATTCLLADLPDAKLWRIDPDADYGPAHRRRRGRIDLGWVRQPWPDIARLVASIHTGAVSAHDVIECWRPARV